MEAFLRGLLPRVLPPECSFEIHPFQGKPDLLAKLGGRLLGYARWLPDDWRLSVLVDRDQEDCRALKRELEGIARSAGFRTRTRSGGPSWQVVNRIAIEELEAWYFGNWDAVRRAYPRASARIPRQARYRQPDSIRGGTWEQFERVMQRFGYFRTGLRKTEAARAIGAHVEPARSTSRSFKHLTEAIAEATTQEQ